MEKLMKKAAYIKGLCDGMEISENTKEGKVLLAMVELLEEMTLEMTEIVEAYDELDSYVESIDEAVLELEEVIFEDDEEGCSCGCHDDESGYVDLECPNCGDKIYLDEEMFDEEEEIVCPNCDEEISFESSCGGCDCSCNEVQE